MTKRFTALTKFIDSLQSSADFGDVVLDAQSGKYVYHKSKLAKELFKGAEEFLNENSKFYEVSNRTAPVDLVNACIKGKADPTGLNDKELFNLVAALFEVEKNSPGAVLDVIKNGILLKTLCLIKEFDDKGVYLPPKKSHSKNNKKLESKVALFEKVLLLLDRKKIDQALALAQELLDTDDDPKGIYNDERYFLCEGISNFFLEKMNDIEKALEYDEYRGLFDKSYSVYHVQKVMSLNRPYEEIARAWMLSIVCGQTEYAGEFLRHIISSYYAPIALSGLYFSIFEPLGSMSKAKVLFEIALSFVNGVYVKKDEDLACRYFALSCLNLSPLDKGVCRRRMQMFYACYSLYLNGLEEIEISPSCKVNNLTAQINIASQITKLIEDEFSKTLDERSDDEIVSLVDELKEYSVLKASYAGSITAQLYEQGTGVRKDPCLQLYFLNSAGKNGDHSCNNKMLKLMHELPELYDRELAGEAAVRSDGFYYQHVCIELFDKKLKKAFAGDSDAMYDTAYCYMQGYGTDRNMKEAMQWYSKAALQDHLPSVMALLTIKDGVSDEMRSDLEQKIMKFKSGSALARGYIYSVEKIRKVDPSDDELIFSRDILLEMTDEKVEYCDLCLQISIANKILNDRGVDRQPYFDEEQIEIYTSVKEELQKRKRKKISGPKNQSA